MRSSDATAADNSRLSAALRNTAVVPTPAMAVRSVRDAVPATSRSARKVAGSSTKGRAIERIRPSEPVRNTSPVSPYPSSAQLPSDVMIASIGSPEILRARIPARFSPAKTGLAMNIIGDARSGAYAAISISVTTPRSGDSLTTLMTLAKVVPL